MLKKTIIAALLTLGLSVPVGASDSPVGTEKDIFVESATGKKIAIDVLVNKLVDYDGVFFGEFHDQDYLHQVEKELFAKLYAVKKDKLVLSLEMIEADQQTNLNNYLEGKMTEEEFLKVSKPWPNYVAAYGPLVNYAKEQHLPVIASNVPRILAAALAKTGSLDSIEPELKPFLPESTYTPAGAYRTKFFEFMSKGMGTKAPNIPQSRIEPMFKAQCLKDDKMAESIWHFKRNHQDAFIYHVNGSFHSDGHLGTVEKLAALAPKLKIAVITPKEILKQSTIADNWKTDGQDGEYILYFTRVEND